MNLEISEVSQLKHFLNPVHVEHLITLLGASSRTKASATVQRFFRAPMESIALYALFGSYSRIFDINIRHRVSVSLHVPSHMVEHIR